MFFGGQEVLFRRRKPRLRKLYCLPAGHAEQYGELPKREHLWTIYWQTADVSATRQGFSTGDLRTVTGTVYKEEVAYDRFFCGQRTCREEHVKRLLLKNNVHVISRTNKATLICDSLVYDGVKKLLTATGNVRASKQYKTAAWVHFPILLATPDLKRFGARRTCSLLHEYRHIYQRDWFVSFGLGQELWLYWAFPRWVMAGPLRRSISTGATIITCRWGLLAFNRSSLAMGFGAM